jgi:hypothetical protein
MPMRRTLALPLVAALCVFTITPGLAAPGSPAGTPVTPSPAPTVKEQAPSAPGEPNQALQAATKDLGQARMHMAQTSPHDVQWHRAKAVQDIDQAIQELR